MYADFIKKSGKGDKKFCMPAKHCDLHKFPLWAIIVIIFLFAFLIIAIIWGCWWKNRMEKTQEAIDNNAIQMNNNQFPVEGVPVQKGLATAGGGAVEGVPRQEYDDGNQKVQDADRAYV